MAVAGTVAVALVIVVVAGAAIRIQEQALLSRLAGKVEKVAGLGEAARGTSVAAIIFVVIVPVVLTVVNRPLDSKRRHYLRNCGGNKSSWHNECTAKSTCRRRISWIDHGSIEVIMIT